MLIQTEKSIADSVLEKLEIIDPTAILAGGAPRDWFLGNTASDLDFYIYTRSTQLTLEKSFQLLGLPVTRLRQKGHNVRTRLDNLYNSMPNLQSVYETEYRGKKVQIMVMSEPTYKGVVDQFATSISKFWYKSGRIMYNTDAEQSVIYKTIKVSYGYSPHSPYVQKMMRRFPDYHFVFSLTSDKPVYNSRPLNIYF